MEDDGNTGDRDTGNNKLDQNAVGVDNDNNYEEGEEDFNGYVTG